MEIDTDKLDMLYIGLSLQLEAFEAEAKRQGLLNDINFMKHYYMFWGKRRMLEILKEISYENINKKIF